MKTLIIFCVLVAGARAGIYYKGAFSPSTPEEAENVVVEGSSGVVMKDGNNRQKMVKRSTAGFVTEQGSVGHAGVVRTDGTIEPFSADFAHSIVLFSPSGIVTDTGKNLQFDRNLHFRKKRDLLGPSGFITEDGTPVQFSRAGVTLVLEGPSGYVFSDGTAVQKKAKRATFNYGHSFGDAGIVTNAGKLYQLPAGVTIVSAGPSGAVLSDGNNIQF